jgi:hypothetical protein
MTHATLLSRDVDVYAVVEVSYADPGGTAVWVDESAYLQALSVSRGRSTELDQPQVGRIVVEFDNQDGHFDPTNISSPHYPNVAPVRRIRVRSVVDTGRTSFTVRSSRVRDDDNVVLRAAPTEIPLFSGLVEEWQQSWLDDGAKAAAAAAAVDGLSTIAAAQYTATGLSAELSGARIARVLDGIGWPAADRLLDSGVVQIVGGNVDAKALTHIQDVAKSEGGLLFVDTLGRVVFLDANRSVVVNATNTWGESDAELAYGGLTVVYDDARIWNDIIVETAGDTTSTSSDSSSIARFYRRSLVMSSLINLDADRNARANALLAAYKDPKIRVAEMQPSPETLDEWVRIFRAELGDGLRVRRRPPGGGLIEQDSTIEGINVDFLATAEQRVKWRLSGIVDSLAARVFYLGTTTSDLSGGADFNRYLDTEPGQVSSIAVSVAPSSTETSYGFTADGAIPVGVDTVGSYSVRVRVVVPPGQDGDKLYLSVRLRRVNSGGTVQASSSEGYGGSQVLYQVGIKTFNLSSIDLGTWASGDRLRVDYIFSNESSSQTPTVTIEAGSTDCEVITPLV